MTAEGKSLKALLDRSLLDSYRIIRPDEFRNFVECDVLAEGTAGQNRRWRAFFTDYSFSGPARVLIPGLDSIALIIYKNASTRIRWRLDSGWNDEHVGPGSIGIIGTGHSIEGEWFEQLTVSHIYLPTELLVGTAASAFEQDYRRLEAVNAIVAGDHRLQALGEMLVQELRSPGGGTNLAADSLASLLSVHLLRRYHHNFRPSRTVRGDARLTKGQRARVVDFIEANVSRNFGLLELASAAGMSGTNLRRCFKNTFGESPHQFVLNHRIAMAIEQICQTDLGFSQIATLTGFANRSHMTVAVKKATGLTPGALRKS
jgi:AraC family transcriptional regulator